MTIPNNPKAQAVLFNVGWGSDHQITKLTLAKTLSERNLEHEKKFGSSVVYELAQVGDSFWLGSPEFSQITFLDLNAANITKPTPVRLHDALTPEPYENVTISDSKSLFRLNNINGTIHDILPLGKIILVKVGARGYVPFDRNGRQLLERRLLLKWALLRDAHNGVILTVTNRRKAQLLAKQAGEPLPDPIGNIGEEDTYPYLVLMRLKPEFR